MNSVTTESTSILRPRNVETSRAVVPTSTGPEDVLRPSTDDDAHRAFFETSAITAKTSAVGRLMCVSTVPYAISRIIDTSQAAGGSVPVPDPPVAVHVPVLNKRTTANSQTVARMSARSSARSQAA